MFCAVLCTASTLSGCSRIDENISITTEILPDYTGGLLPDNGADTAFSTDTDGDISVDGVTLTDNTTDNSRYIYSQLSDKEKEYYNIIRDAALSFESSAIFPENVDPELMKKVFVAVYNQEEEIFWLSSVFYRPNEAADRLKLSYRFDREDIPEMQRRIDEVSDRIFSQFTEETSDYEKLKAFHDHIVLNCTFSKDTEFANTIYGCLADGYAQCEGYAFAFDYLCSLADIDCFTVSGTNSEGSSHAWNIVRLEDMWYNVDCTWDDPILDPPDTEYLRHYYFLVSDSDISGVTHIPDNTYFSLPICSSGENYYKREGLFAQSADEGISMLSECAADALRAGRKDAGVRFADRQSYEKAITRLFDGHEIKKIITSANAAAERKVMTGRYVRYCNDVELIIHISMIFE